MPDSHVRCVGPALTCAVLCCPMQVTKLVEEFSHEDFARAGSKALHAFRLNEGPLSNAGGPLQHTLEPQLRKYGMPTRLNKGVVELNADFEVSSEWQDWPAVGMLCQGRGMLAGFPPPWPVLKSNTQPALMILQAPSRRVFCHAVWPACLSPCFTCLPCSRYVERARCWMLTRRPSCACSASKWRRSSCACWRHGMQKVCTTWFDSTWRKHCAVPIAISDGPLPQHAVPLLQARNLRSWQRTTMTGGEDAEALGSDDLGMGDA